MANVVKKVDYYYALLRNEVGVAADVFAKLEAENVVLHAFSGFPTGRRVQLDLVPKKPSKLVQAARRMKIPLSAKKRCFLVTGPDAKGALVPVFRKLAEKHIGIVACTAVASGGGRFGALLWVDPRDFARATRALNAR